MDFEKIDERLVNIKKEWKKQKIALLQKVLDDHGVTSENVKERCKMHLKVETMEENLYIDGQLVFTIRDMAWHKHYE